VARRETAEAALKQAQRLEAVGQLTGGVAHDFNNLLMIVSGHLVRLKKAVAADPKAARAAEAIEIAAHRGQSITRQLLSFARRQPVNPVVVDPAACIAAMRPMLASSVGTAAELVVEVAPDLAAVRIDVNEFELALLNLVLNARDAMPSGGKLTVEVQNTSLGESDVDVNGEARPGDYVMVAVTDTGTGMTTEVARRAFEPFFTTKEVGKGTGLGLSMVYGFARQSGGLMQIRSEPGNGTAVRLFFPRVGTPRASAAPTTTQRTSPSGSETILVVEDDDMVRSYVEGELKALGYRVIVTRHAPAALDILRGPESIDLLFTDVVMPGGMFGTELAKEAARLRPALKILLTSGHTEHPVDATDGDGREVRILNKPYRRHDLASMLRSALKAS